MVVAHSMLDFALRQRASLSPLAMASISMVSSVAAIAPPVSAASFGARPSRCNVVKRSGNRCGRGFAIELGKRSARSRLTVRASEEVGSPAGASGDSIVSEVALLEEEPETPGVASAVATKERKVGALQKGGTLSGKEALGKDPSLATLGKSRTVAVEAFEDARWIKGNWDISKFTKEGKVNWDGVIDAEVKRRKWLEDNPEASSNQEPVLFETSTVPWWAWVKRFHLPEAELLNGRAAMVGYLAAYLVDSATGIGLVDQQNSFFGKVFLFITIVGVLLIRKNEDLDTLKNLAKESTFYDKQWQASWKEDTPKEEKPFE